MERRGKHQNMPQHTSTQVGGQIAAAGVFMFLAL